MRTTVYKFAERRDTTALRHADRLALCGDQLTPRQQETKLAIVSAFTFCQS
jgi:hypothetical protein